MIFKLFLILSSKRGGNHIGKSDHPLGLYLHINHFLAAGCPKQRTSSEMAVHFSVSLLPRTPCITNCELSNKMLQIFFQTSLHQAHLVRDKSYYQFILISFLQVIEIYAKKSFHQETTFRLIM